MKKLSALTSFLLPAVLPVTLEAQQRDTSARNIEPVSVRGSRAPSVTGGATSVVIRPDSLPVPLLAAPQLADVLRQTAFVLVRQNSRGEMEIGVRGSDSRQAAVLLDGLPLTIGWDSRTDPSLLPTTGIETITVVRGLSSVLGGANTLGGIIRMDLNAPVSRNTPQTASLRVGTGIDQYSGRVISANGVAPFSVGNGTLRIRGGITSRARDGFALSGGDAGDGFTGGAADPGDAGNSKLRTNTDQKQLDGFAALRWDHNSGAYIGVTATGYDTERGVAPEQHITAPRYWRYPSQTRTLGMVNAGTGVRKTPLGFGSLSASAGTSKQELEIETYANRQYATVSARELGSERSNIARIEGSHSLPLNMQLRVAATSSDVQYDETLAAENPASVATRYQQKLTSFGAELDLPLFSRFLLSGGVVQDEAKTPKTGGRTSLGTLTQTGWRVGSTFKVNDGVRLHASVSERARFAALRELYSGALNRFDPNPNLLPETLLGFEAGVTLDGGVFAEKGLQMQLVGFAHRLDDAVVRITLPNRLFRRINRDEIKSQGAEALVSWTPSGLRGTTFTGDATLQRIRVYDQTITSGSNERFPEHNPERRASLAVISPAFAGIRASAMARHIGTQYCQHPDLGRQVELKSQTIGDAALQRGFSVRRGGLLQRLTALVAMDNVGNVTAYDQCGLPQAGRTLRFGLTLQ
ncbi:MAG: TonB-dependent receptor [Gemmatimonadaceae bacterium]|nr:TonB-dependent receptor [Gemmatimonadaceae bacterium]